MKYTETKQLSKKEKITVNIDLSNGYFSATCDVREWMKDPYEYGGRKIWFMTAGGCNHELIKEHFPHLSIFCDLHLHDDNGVTMYPISNGMYYLHREGGKFHDAFKRQFFCEDKDEFEKVWEMGIIEYVSWVETQRVMVLRPLAKKAIDYLNELTGANYEQSVRSHYLNSDMKGRFDDVIFTD